MLDFNGTANLSENMNEIDDFYNSFSMCKDTIVSNVKRTQKTDSPSTSSTNSLNDPNISLDQLTSSIMTTNPVQKHPNRCCRKQIYSYRKSIRNDCYNHDPIASRNEIKAKFR